MTTIAYKDGIIAYDSRFTSSDVIEDDDGEKCYIRDGVYFFISGSVCDYEALVDSYFAGVAVRKNIDAMAFVFGGGQLYTTSVHLGKFWVCKERMDVHGAIGSGRKFALAFMDAGMNAEDAIKGTCKRDIYTGGTVRTCQLSVVK